MDGVEPATAEPVGQGRRSALSELTESDVVDLDEERRASMVSNLMVVLCGDQPPSAVMNTGSLYT